jgi:hypothetical protein
MFALKPGLTLPLSLTLFPLALNYPLSALNSDLAFTIILPLTPAECALVQAPILSHAQ